MADFGIVSVPVIVVLCLLIGKAWKTSSRLDDKWIPCVCGASGLVLGVLIWITNGAYPVDWFGIGDPWMAAAVGVVSGFAATGLHQAVKQHVKEIDKLAEDEGGEWR
jgi:hypothetical protein